MTTIINLLLISVIVSLIWNTGFWLELDAIINKRFKLYHLPNKPFMCTTCQCWWLCLLALLIMGDLSLLTIVYALIAAHLTKIFVPLFKTLENFGLLIIEKMNSIL